MLSIIGRIVHPVNGCLSGHRVRPREGRSRVEHGLILRIGLVRGRLPCEFVIVAIYCGVIIDVFVLVCIGFWMLVLGKER